MELANFHSKVDKRGPDECWPWKAGKFNTGYGSFSVGGNAFSSHRLAYFLLTGNDPGTMCVLHKCDNRQCCNPTHYFLGTLEDNVADMTAKGRAARGDRHGSRTHPESVPRGNRHGSRLHPESLARGDRSGSRLHPERLARGDRSGPRLHPEKLMRGEKQWKSKLTEDAVREIRRRSHDGESSSSIAVSYGITRFTVWDVLKRTWKHVI